MLSMTLESGECGGHVVVVPRGELDLVDAAAVAAALKALAAREPRIIVDLAGLGFIDVSGVAALESGRRHARDVGGDLLLAAPQPPAGRVLGLIWDNGGFAVPASVAEAVASTGAPRSAVPIRWPAPRRPVGPMAPPPTAGISG
jgi:anti-sigma B factor antagonist